jgi:hypothetical protein
VNAARGSAERGALSPVLFTGFAVASIGGPVALAAIFVPQAIEGATGLATVLGVVVFAAPLAIWLRYSERIASPGGLSAFVEAAAGRRAAVAHAWIWTLSYFLYLPYTVTFVVYDVLTPVFPGIVPARPALELVLPVAIVLLVLAPLRSLLVAVLVAAGAQLALVLVLAAVELARAPSPKGTFSTSSLDPTARQAAAVGLLFVCASPPLYLGGEVRRGPRTVRSGVALAFALVAVYVLVAAIPLAGVPADLRDAAVPGAAIAQAYSGRPLAIVVGLGAAISVALLVVAEYIALSRLFHWLHGFAIRRVLLAIAVPFLVADAISLVDPERFYDDLVRPSLGALFVSQLIVFVVYPLYRRRVAERVGPLAIGAAAVASGLAAWGFYVLVSQGAAT